MGTVGKGWMEGDDGGRGQGGGGSIRNGDCGKGMEGGR